VINTGEMNIGLHAAVTLSQCSVVAMEYSPANSSHSTGPPMQWWSDIMEVARYWLSIVCYKTVHTVQRFVACCGFRVVAELFTDVRMTKLVLVSVGGWG